MKKLLFALVFSLQTLASDPVPPESPWTTWAQKPLLFSLLNLLSIRDSLLDNNLFSTQDFENNGSQVCPGTAKYVRSIEGTCNSLVTPLMGAAGTAFGRNIPLEKVKRPTFQEIMDPNPRLISQKLLTRKEFQPLKNMNVLGVAWVQFMIHDWLNHANEGYDTHSVYEIPLEKNDPLGIKSLIVPKTARHSSQKTVAYKNMVTHWWDGSQIYGSDMETHRKLRSFVDGKLLIDGNGHLPRNFLGQELTGMTENWWLGLSLIHTLFVKEHNSIASALKVEHPEWTDQQLFDVARLINAALMAKIQTVEWTPQLNLNKTIKAGMYSTWNGMLGLGATIKTVVGGKNDLRNVPYSITEEFISAYRFHPFLPESVTINSIASKESSKVIPLPQMRNQNAAEILDSTSMSDLLYSFAKAPAGAQTLNNYPQFMQNLDLPIIGKTDLGTVEIIRDRERGVPRYNEFRRLMQLKPITKFEDLTKDPQKLASLKEIYRNDIELIDLMVGTLAEEVRPEGLGFGETFFQIFIAMTPRRLESDRFYTTDFRPEVYTKLGMNWIKKNGFKSVLLRHHPELTEKVSKTENPFAPWKE